MLWIERDPDTTAKDLMARLSGSDPERFSDAQFRTLQRRVKDWRGVMVKRLVYTAFDDYAVEQRHKGESLLVGAGFSG